MKVLIKCVNEIPLNILGVFFNTKPPEMIQQAVHLTARVLITRYEGPFNTERVL